MTTKKIQIILVYTVLASAWTSECLVAQGIKTSDKITLEEGGGNPLSREGEDELPDWNKAVRGFRREHNFVFTLGAVNSRWFISDRLALKDRTTVPTRDYFGFFSYTFHLPIYRGIGYYLGSGTGTIIKDRNRKSLVSASYSYSLPGFIMGLTANLSPALRVNCGISGYLERIDGFVYKQLPSEFNDKTSLSMTMRVWAASLSSDFFFKLPWAMRLESEFRHLSFRSPKGVVDNTIIAYPIQKDEWRFGAGVVYHLL